MREDEWNYEKALAAQIAVTRDGRPVLTLRSGMLDGDFVLLGEVCTSRPPYNRRVVEYESHF